jgi:hypothetical protein
LVRDWAAFAGTSNPRWRFPAFNDDLVPHEDLDLTNSVRPEWLKDLDEPGFHKHIEELRDSVAADAGPI